MAKANRVLPREHTGHSKHPLPTTQDTTLHMDILRLIIFFSAKDGAALYSQQKQDQGLAKFRHKLKKIGKPLGYSGMTLIKSLTIIQWK